MLANTLVFLVLLMSGTEKPVMVLMGSFQTAKECNQILEQVPKESKNKWACIRVDTGPLRSETVPL